MNLPSLIGKRKLSMGAIGVFGLVKIAGLIAAGTLAAPLGGAAMFLVAAVSVAYIIKQGDIDKIDSQFDLLERKKEAYKSPFQSNWKEAVKKEGGE